MTKIPGAIDWKKSAARKILLGDIENHLLPDDMPADEAWRRLYKHMGGFEGVPFKQFEKQLKAHREQVWGRLKRAADDEVRLRNYRNLVPEPTTFRRSATHMLLRKDVAAEMEAGIYRASSDEL